MALAVARCTTQGTLRCAPARRYFAFGYQIDSEIELPVVEGNAEAAADWSFVWADSEEAIAPLGALVSEQHCNRLCHNGQVISRTYRDNSGTWVWSRDTGWYFIFPDARQVVVYPDATADERTIGLVLIGHISIFILHQLGYPSLHASSVVADGGAIAFVGPSGTGKSTMAGCFLRHGATLHSDDVLPLEQRADGIYARPGAPFMKVWEGTARETLGIDAELPDLTPSISKKLLRLNGNYSFSTTAAPLRAIYLVRRFDPQLEPDQELRIQRLNQREAFALLMSQSRRYDMLLPPERARLLPLYARLMAQATVGVAHVPNGYEHHDAVRQGILADLAAPAS